jgi:hypothetical protein
MLLAVIPAIKLGGCGRFPTVFVLSGDTPRQRVQTKGAGNGVGVAL